VHERNAGRPAQKVGCGKVLSETAPQPRLITSFDNIIIMFLFSMDPRSDRTEEF